MKRFYTVLAAAGAALVLASCGSRPLPWQRKSDVAKLPAAFPILEQLGVSFCEPPPHDLFVYRRGAFTKNGQPHFDSSRRSQPFDAQAAADLAAMKNALNATGVQITGISEARYGAKGKLSFAEFDLPSEFSRFRYAYSPAYKNLPPDQKREIEHTRINDDWYLIWEDWN